ncbi:MAG: hypothetical protein H6737_13395 [Alphaproteobacteria bacterium]|nr:hypothetical protein [Alphaproteobacteria bacterium]
MTALLALLVGFGGGLWHLGFTALRARALGSGRLGPALALLPVGLAGPAVAMLGVMQLAPAFVWAVLLGLVVARFTLVGPLGRRLEGAWTP